jgi:hypothetical protein
LVGSAHDESGSNTAGGAAYLIEGPGLGVLLPDAIDPETGGFIFNNVHGFIGGFTGIDPEIAIGYAL